MRKQIVCLMLFTFVILTAYAFAAAPQTAEAVVTVAAPTNLVAACWDTTITLSWQDNSDNETEFEVQVKPPGGDWNTYGTTLGTKYVKYDLTVPGTYSFRVRAVLCLNGEDIFSDFSNEVSYIYGNVPSAPSNLNANAGITGSRVILQWTDNSDNELGFTIEEKPVGGVWREVIRRSTNTYEYWVRESGTYSFRIVAYNVYGDSGYSNEIDYTFDTHYPPPYPPKKVTVFDVGEDALISWFDDSDNTEGYNLEKKSPGGDWYVLADLPHETPGFWDWFSAAGTYMYRVRSYNEENNHYLYSDYSEVVSYTYDPDSTPTNPDAPAAPSNLRCLSSGPDIDLRWTDNSDNDLGFLVERGTSSGIWVEIGCPTPNITSFSDTLTTTGTYYYRVRAFNNSGTSDYSNTVTYTLDIDNPDGSFADVPAAPGNLTAKSVSADVTHDARLNVVLNWTDNSDNEFGFKVEEKAPGGNWREISSPSENTTSMYSGAAETGTYYYRVRAISIDQGGNVYSDYSNTASYSYTGTDIVPTPEKTIMLQIGSPYMAVNGNTMEIDSGRGTVPIITEDRTLLPIRAIVENLGGTVSWDEVTSKVSITENGKTIELWIGSTITYVNGNKKEIDVAPRIINERTMIPIRFVVENMGAEVDWDDASQTVTIRR